MAMSDCPKCWTSPCMCGHDYRDWTPEARQRLIIALNVMAWTKEPPQKTGFYWLRNADSMMPYFNRGNQPIVVFIANLNEFDEDEPVELVIEFTGYEVVYSLDDSFSGAEWYGPLTPPT